MPEEAVEESRAPGASPFSEAGFRRLAARTLYRAAPASESDRGPGAPRDPGDHDLNPDLEAGMAAPHLFVPAAVLVPLVAREALTVLLTRRTDGLPRHAGQIAFPGGRMEESDRDPLAAALRETREEIGLDPGFVEPLGFLDAYRTGTGYRIVPVVALVRPGFELALDASEVAEAFEVPLSFLMDERNHRINERFLRGATRRFHAMPYGHRYIWGATAGIMKNMHQRLFCT